MPRRRPDTKLAHPATARDALGDIAAGLMMGATAMAVVLALGVGVYVVKSKLGINLMPGPSPLHGLYLALR